MFTITTRIIVAYTSVFGLLLLLFSVVIYTAVKDEEMARLEARLESHAEKLHSEIEEQCARGLFPIVSDFYAIRTDGLTGEHFQLTDIAGNTIVADSTLPPVPPLDGHPAPVEQSIFRRGKTRYLSLLVPLEVDRDIRYVLQVAAPTDEIDADLAHLRFLFWLIIPGTLALTGLGAFLITRSALRPLTSMAQTARTISATTLSRRLDLPRANDEVRILGEALNTMIDRLDAAFRSQKQFVADASHEIRTPLTVMRSELEYARRLVSDSAADMNITTALGEIDRLAALADALLLLTRLDAPQSRTVTESVRLDELVTESIQLMTTNAARKQVTLYVTIDAAVEISGDRAWLKSVILNLLDNAIKYSHPGGEVQCRLSTADDGNAIVTVADNGIGITPGDLPHIFQRFYQSDRTRADGSGFGLGLAIVDRVVQLHGGTVAVRSTQGSGSTFIIRLPLKARPASPSVSIP